ncbi:selenocysteine-specific translation elongation factor [Mycobacterium shigaense]|uniref:Selenocysteine-specific translation elongation factor n=1 Tax=Mycobacterium shigaense TaxID=722731 RepID=A0A1Z4EBI3_9MYCO|nr:selenocysteine-specific translation elongation factor [Mycobacterium shigaense]MEA1121350.1 selenocysteine-specific translation elongation factor [Mycobacterium shigaense]BAX90317.1 selenocysteine-specific translation elongation factor [Mycobacterium shigaense]
MATAGHVDHGKSTLIRALTGMEPDRWAEERRRGLTIDLGFAWTTLPSGREISFVDVPGHQRFLGNTLAGLGPAPVVCFVVAADEGWQAQSSDHRDAIAALGIEHGLIVITRADRAPDRADDALAQARTELVGTGLRDAPGLIVSAVEGAGLPELRATLDRVLAQLPPPQTAARLRLWVDRCFSIAGAGTVVTGTFAAGSLARGDRLDLLGAETRSVVIRGLQSRGRPYPAVGPVARVALNLRGVSRDAARRGDALLTPGAWLTTHALDVRRTTGDPLTEGPAGVIAYVGTAAVPARLRPFDDDHARLTLDRQLPLILGDRLVLRDPGGSRALGGVLVLDADPPALRRRGDGARRAAALSGLDVSGDLTAEVARRGAVQESHLRRLGLLHGADSTPPAGVRVLDGWWVHAATYDAWRHRLQAAVTELHTRDPLAEGLSRGAARDLLELPDESLLDALARDAGLEQGGGHIQAAGAPDDLGAAEAAVSELEARLCAEPFHAPEADDLSALRLGARELAAAERAGRVLRLRDGSQTGIVLLPTAPALAMRALARLDQPFTTSQARQALDTSRRVAIPLLEHLDARGWTRRLDAGHREVVR